MAINNLNTWIKKVFSRIPEMAITLENGDITVLGPGYLREKLVECREFLNEINHYIVTLKQEIWETIRELEALKSEYRIELDQLLARDDSVRRGTSYKDRVAIANQILIELLQKITSLEEKKRDLEALDEVLKLKLRELRDANSDIKTSKQLMNTEISIGSFYGNEDKNKKETYIKPEILLEPVESESSKEDLSELFEETDVIVINGKDDGEAKEEKSESTDEDYSDILDLL